MLLEEALAGHKYGNILNTKLSFPVDKNVAGSVYGVAICAGLGFFLDPVPALSKLALLLLVIAIILTVPQKATQNIPNFDFVLKISILFILKCRIRRILLISTLFSKFWVYSWNFDFWNFDFSLEVHEKNLPSFDFVLQIWILFSKFWLYSQILSLFLKFRFFSWSAWKKIFLFFICSWNFDFILEVSNLFSKFWLFSQKA